MSRLMDRMMWSDNNTYPDKREVARYSTVDQVPTVHIAIYPGVITYEDTYPLIASDGAPIAATGRGTWGQLYAAGTQRRF